MRMLLALSMAAVLAGCSGGNSTGPAPLTPLIAPTSTAAPAAAGPTSSGILTIVINRAPAASSSSARRAQFVSPSSSSVGVAVNGGAPNYSSIASSSPLCTTSGTTQTCSVPIAAPAGNDTIGLSFYDGVNGTGNLLGMGTGTTTVTLGTPFTVTIPISAVVAAVAFAITPNSVQGPAAATATLTVAAKDADGNAITGTAPYSAPIAVANNDTTGAITLSATAFSKPTDSITVTYSGAAPATSTTFTTASVTTVTPATLAIPPPHQSLYVTDTTNGIYVFAPGANGNVAPIRRIAGANTGLNSPSGVALDAMGNIYVANGASNAVATSGGNGSITVYAPDANGNVAPIRTITGSNTGMSNPYAPWGISIDGSGNLWAAVVSLSLYSGGSALEFAPGANGNATPIATITGNVAANAAADDVAFDSSGDIHEDPYGVSVLTFAPGTNGNVAPSLKISGSNAFPSGAGLYQMAFDTSGNQYVTAETGAGAILGWPLTANGNIAPTIQITGSNTGVGTGARGIAFDSAGNLYVSNLNAARTATSILVFAPGGNGNVAPIRTIAGSNIGVTTAEYIAISP